MRGLSELHSKLLRLRIEARAAANAVRANMEITSGPDELKRAGDRLWRALDALHGKAGFNPNQPRVPAGNSDGGQWTGTGASNGTVLHTGRASSDEPPANEPLRVTIHRDANMGGNGGPPLIGIGHNGGPPLEDPAQLPPEPPPARKVQLIIAKKAAVWIAKRVLLGSTAAGAALLIIEAAYWLYAERYNLMSYADAPRSLGMLRERALSPRPGYEIHHIDEQGTASKLGEPRSWIDGPENLVLVPKWKHHQITGFYARKDPTTGLTFREQMSRLDRKTRYEKGLDVLRDFGVMQ